MFLEGEFDWVLVLSIVAGVTTLVAILSLWFAITNRVRHVSATDELDMIQKVAEAADKRLFQTLNAIPVALVETDKQGKFVFANRAAHQLLGRRDAELIGLRFHSATWGITYPDGRPVPPDLLPSARALRGQTVKGFQHLLANAANRKKMLVSVTAMPIENEWGDIIGSTAAIVESEGLTTPEAFVPELQPAAAVPVGDDLTRRVFDAASSALVVVGGDGRVREINRTALILLGRSDDVIGMDFADMFLADDERVEGRQAVRAAVIAGDGEAIVSRAGGGVKWNVLPLSRADAPVDALLLAGERHEADARSAADVGPVDTFVADDAHAAETAAHQAAIDQALAQVEAARAEAATARADADRLRAEADAELMGVRRMESVGRLTGGVAHDFNALLGVMTSALDMLLRQADDPQRVRRLGQAALTAGQRGEALTRQLTAFSEGQDAPSRQVLDAGLLLRGVEGRLRAVAGPGVDLMIETPPEPALSLIDPIAFDGAVRALVDNAVQAVGERGSVAVRLQTQLEGGLRLSVRDSGPGMDAELAARATEPFFTTRDGAAGLGLSQAYAFARQSGGVLSIDSSPGEGAEVAITLPQVA